MRLTKKDSVHRPCAAFERFDAKVCSWLSACAALAACSSAACSSPDTADAAVQMDSGSPPACTRDLAYLDGPFGPAPLLDEVRPLGLEPSDGTQITWQLQLSTRTSSYGQAWLVGGEDLTLDLAVSVGSAVPDGDIPRRVTVTLDGEPTLSQVEGVPSESVAVPLGVDRTGMTRFVIPGGSFVRGGQTMHLWSIADRRTTQYPTFAVFVDEYAWRDLEETPGGRRETRTGAYYPIVRLNDSAPLWLMERPTSDGHLDVRIDIGIGASVYACAGERELFAVVALLDGEQIPFDGAHPRVVANVGPGEHVVYETSLSGIPIDVGHRLEFFQLTGLHRAMADLGGAWTAWATLPSARVGVAFW